MITLKELAKELKCSTRTIYNKIEQGMPHYRIGTDYRFVLEEVKEWMKGGNKNVRTYD